MKRLVYFLCGLFLLAACGKEVSSSFWQEPYASLEDAEKRLIHHYDTLYGNGHAEYRFLDEVVALVLNDSNTIHYPFQVLQDSGYVDVVTSEDGNLRFYTWDDYSGGTFVSFSSIIQWRSGKKVFARHASAWGIENDFNSTDEEDMGCCVKNIYTLDTPKKPTYLLNLYNRESSNWGYESVMAVQIINGKLRPAKIFVNKKGELSHEIGVEYTIADWYSRSNDGEGWDDWLFKFDEQTKTLYVPIAEPEITDQYDIYQPQNEGGRMLLAYSGTSGGGWLHSSIRKFKRLETLFDTEDYRIRVDEMDDGSYRYCSWKKGKAMADAPDLIITNGIKDKDSNYTFCSDGYRYTVSEKGIIITKKGRVILNQKKVDKRT